MQKRLSVIVPYFNRRTFLREAVQSVLSELDLEQDELLAVDDGSTDGSFRTIEDLPIRHLRLKASQGPSGARNYALSGAVGRYVTFLDSDDRMLPGAIAPRLSYLERHPEEVAVGGYAPTLINETGEVIGPYENIQLYRVARPPYRLTREFLLEHRKLPLHLWLVIFRRELFEAPEPFDPWLHCGEDVDFFLRLLKEKTVLYLDCPVAQYRIHGENASLKWRGGEFHPTEAACVSQFFVCHQHGLSLKESPFDSK